jgi:anti-sigma-K factor RskA
LEITPPSAYRRTWIRWAIWAAALASVAACALLPIALEEPTSFRPSQAPGGWLVIVLAVIGLATALSTWVARLLMLERPVRRGTFDPRTRSGARRADGSSILVWALCQLVAVYGVSLYLVGGEERHLYAFLTSSALLLWIHAPRQASLRRAARRLEAGKVAGKIG